MGYKIGLVELKTVNEDGTLLSRLQMEEQLRKETVYHRRLRAFKMGLPNKVAQHMLPISVTHWLLDQWIQKGSITGEVLGIRSEFDADDNKDYLRQLTQRLVQFVEHGLAIKPNPGEGIDMSQFNGQPGFPPMPPMPSGAQPQQQTFVPPPPPPMPGMPMPGGAPGYPQQPQMGGYPQGMPPMPPIPQAQQNFVPQPQPSFPPQAQQPQQHPTGAPTKAEAARQWGKAGSREDGSLRTRRTKEEVAEDAAYEAWVAAGGDPNVGSAPAQQQQAPQQMPPQQVQQPQHQVQAPPTMLAPPNPFGNNAAMPPPQFAAMPTAFQAPAASTTVTGLATEEQVNQLNSRLSLIEKGLAMALRVMYHAEGDADLYKVLTEVCKIRP